MGGRATPSEQTSARTQCSGRAPANTRVKRGLTPTKNAINTGTAKLDPHREAILLGRELSRTQLGKKAPVDQVDARFASDGNSLSVCPPCPSTHTTQLRRVRSAAGCSRHGRRAPSDARATAGGPAKAPRAPAAPTRAPRPASLLGSSAMAVWGLQLRRAAGSSPFWGQPCATTLLCFAAVAGTMWGPAKNSRKIRQSCTCTM